MAGTRITIELSSEELQLLDKLAQPLMVFEKPMTQYMWLTTTEEGKYHVNVLNGRPEWQNKSSEQVNKYIHDKYIEAIGYSKIGRPPLSKARAQVIASLLAKTQEP